MDINNKIDKNDDKFDIKVMINYVIPKNVLE